MLCGSFRLSPEWCSSASSDTSHRLVLRNDMSVSTPTSAQSTVADAVFHISGFFLKVQILGGATDSVTYLHSSRAACCVNSASSFPAGPAWLPVATPAPALLTASDRKNGTQKWASNGKRTCGPLPCCLRSAVAGVCDHAAL